MKASSLPLSLPPNHNKLCYDGLEQEAIQARMAGRNYTQSAKLT